MTEPVCIHGVPQRINQFRGVKCADKVPMTDALQAARERLEAYVLSYASPSLVAGDNHLVGEQVERDRASGRPTEVLRRLVSDVVEAARVRDPAVPF